MNNQKSLVQKFEKKVIKVNMRGCRFHFTGFLRKTDDKNTDLYFNNYHLIVSSEDYFKTKIRNYEITENKETSRLNIYYFIALSLIISLLAIFTIICEDKELVILSFINIFIIFYI